MRTHRQCAFCGRTGQVGRDVVPYRFTKKYKQWLCSIFTDPKCSAARYRAFRRWRRKKIAPPS